MDPQELRALETTGYECLREAVTRGDTETALVLLDEVMRNRTRFVDLFTTWIDVLLSVIAQNLGDDVIRKTYEQVAEVAIQPNIGEVTRLDLEQKVRQRAYLWGHMHHTGFYIDEDDEKFTFTAHCSTGGAIMDRGPRARIAKAHPWTKGRENLPAYCAHCIVVFELGSIKEFGYPTWIFEPPHNSGEPCVQHIYKDPSRIPAEYYASLGLATSPGPRTRG